jgi:hypothetical protein
MTATHLADEMMSRSQGKWRYTDKDVGECLVMPVQMKSGEKRKDDAL